MDCNHGYNMSSHPTVVFVCEHGAAKSVIAAAYLSHYAEASGVPLRTVARGTEPEPVLLPAAMAGLLAAGLQVPDHQPQRATPDELATATTVVSFGPRVEGLVSEEVPCRYWRDVPAVSDGYDAARDAIVVRVVDLLTDLHRVDPPAV